MGKYTENFMKLKRHDSAAQASAKTLTWVFGQEQDEEAYYEKSPLFAEITMVLGNGVLNAVSSTDGPVSAEADNNTYRQKHMNVDKMMCFYGTNPYNQQELGAHVKFHIGDGDEEQVFEFDQPRGIFVPKGIPYGPIEITNATGNIFIYSVYTNAQKSKFGTVLD